MPRWGECDRCLVSTGPARLLAGLAIMAARPGCAYEDGTRLAWDYSTAAPVTSGVYARTKPLRDGSWLLAYSDGPAVYVRTSTDGTRTFSAPRLIANPAGYNSTNAELIQLANGWVLLGYNARPTSANERVLPYQIRTIMSRDSGKTWENEKIAYAAGKTGDVGCWEPAFLQLPSGEVQLFFSNEAPYPSTHEQEIGLLRSNDDGLTWNGYRQTSFRPGYRDGMPVPVALADRTTLVYSIEDNGLVPGNFKPAIVASTFTDDWNGGTVGATSAQRWTALRSDYSLGASVYAGAPYLARFAGGETILSVQSTELRSGTDLTYAAPRVYLGTAAARDFARPSTPLPWLPPGASALWNSVTVLSDDEVLLASSVSGVSTPVGSHAIWLARARILRPIDVPLGSVAIDGLASPGEWAAKRPGPAPAFIGATSMTALSAYLQADAANLYFLFEVKDAHVATTSNSNGPVGSDSIEIYLDPRNHSGSTLGADLYRVIVGASGDVDLASTSSGSTWSAWIAPGVVAHRTIAGTANNAGNTDGGYTIEVAVPWSPLGGRPAAGTGWGIHLRLNDGATTAEDLGGDDPARPGTWMRATLRGPQTPTITAGPITRTVAPGGSAAFAVFATGDAPLSYQWFKDGIALSTATAAQLIVPAVTAADVGSYTAEVSNAAGTATCTAAKLILGSAAGSRVVNLSTRGAVLTGASVQIAGFVVGGDNPRTLLIRGIGPGLATTFPSLFSPGDVLGDPVLTLRAEAAVLSSNDDWGNQPAASVVAAASSQVGAFPLAAGSHDAALLVSLRPGTYTVQPSGNGSSTGIGVIELYDVDASGSSRLVNLSTRGPLGPGGAVMISGMVISGGSRTLLIRGVGPGLASTFPNYFSSEMVVPGPQLRLLDAKGDEIARNDDWAANSDVAAIDRATAQAGAFPLPAGSRDAALLVTVPPGNYTALVSDATGRSGIALVEAYDVSSSSSR